MSGGVRFGKDNELAKEFYDNLDGADLEAKTKKSVDKAQKGATAGSGDASITVGSTGPTVTTAPPPSSDYVSLDTPTTNLAENMYEYQLVSGKIQSNSSTANSARIKSAQSKSHDATVKFQSDMKKAEEQQKEAAKKNKKHNILSFVIDGAEMLAGAALMAVPGMQVAGGILVATGALQAVDQGLEQGGVLKGKAGMIIGDVISDVSTVATGVALMATGAGALAGGAMIISGVAEGVDQGLTQSGVVTDGAAEALNIATMAVGVTAGVVAIGCGLASASSIAEESTGLADQGIEMADMGSSAASDAGQAVDDSVQAAEENAQNLSRNLKTLAKTVSMLARAGQGATQIDDGIVTIERGYNLKHANTAEAHATDDQTQIKVGEQDAKKALDDMKFGLQQYEQSSQAVNQILNSIYAAKTQTAGNLGTLA